MDFRMAVRKAEPAGPRMIGGGPIHPCRIDQWHARVDIQHSIIDAVGMLVHQYPGHRRCRVDERAHFYDCMAIGIVLPARSHGGVHRDAAGARRPAQCPLGGARVHVGRAFVNLELPGVIRGQQRVLIIRQEQRVRVVGAGPPVHITRAPGFGAAIVIDHQGVVIVVRVRNPRHRQLFAVAHAHDGLGADFGFG